MTALPNFCGRHCPFLLYPGVHAASRERRDLFCISAHSPEKTGRQGLGTRGLHKSAAGRSKPDKRDEKKNRLDHERELHPIC